MYTYIMFPDEIWERIFDIMHIADIKSLALSCKKFARIIKYTTTQDVIPGWLLRYRQKQTILFHNVVCERNTSPLYIIPSFSFSPNSDNTKKPPRYVSIQ